MAKGGVFSQIAEITLCTIEEGMHDISFFNEELNQWYDITLEKDIRGHRVSDWF